MFSIPLLPLIQSDSPISSISVSGLASWMTFNTNTSTIELAQGYTAVPPPPQNYTITVTATNAVGSASGTVNIHVYAVAPPVVKGPSAISHTVGLTQTVSFTATNNPSVWSISPTGPDISIDSGSTGATLTINAAFVSDGLYSISASNAGGTGSTITDITLAVPLNPLYWEYISAIVDTVYGSTYINIYDQPAGGNLIATMAYSGLDTNSSGSFNVTGSLIDGNTYYAEGLVGWGYMSGNYDSSGTTIQTTPGGTQQVDNMITSTYYSTSSRLAFVYDINTPNTIVFTLTTTSY